MTAFINGLIMDNFLQALAAAMILVTACLVVSRLAALNSQIARKRPASAR